VACHQDGLTCNNGDVSIDRGYWAWRSMTSGSGINSTIFTDGPIELHTSVCGRGRCVGGPFTSSNYEPCSKDRDQSLTNILCGRCREGYMEFGSSCIGMFPRRVALYDVALHVPNG
jgi:hypothetical protein